MGCLGFMAYGVGLRFGVAKNDGVLGCRLYE